MSHAMDIRPIYKKKRNKVKQSSNCTEDFIKKISVKINSLKLI